MAAGPSGTGRGYTLRVEIGLGGAALAGSAAIVATCALLPNPSTKVIVWLGGFGLATQVLLVATAVVITVVIRSSTGAAVDVVRVGLARRLLLVIALAAALAAASAGAVAVAVADSYELAWPAAVALVLAILALPAPVLLPLGTVFSHKAFVAPPTPARPRWIALPVERTRRMWWRLHLTALVLAALGLTGLVSAVIRFLVDRLPPQEFLLDGIVYAFGVSGGLGLSIATLATRDGRVNVHGLDQARQALDALAIVGLVFVAVDWLVSGLRLASTTDPPSPTLASIHFALLAMTLLGLPLSHAMLHRTLTVPPSAHVQPHPEPPSSDWPAPAWSPPPR